jgi:threonyl-tRNA synthetase
MNHNQNIEDLRHSAAHLLAGAVLKLYPDAKPAIGPSIDAGFYYDFDFAEPLSDADLHKIEKAMHQLVGEWQGFEKQNVSADEAKQTFPNNQYKHELIDEFVSESKDITLYKSGNFIDLCRGGHVENPSLSLKHFKLLSLAGAYWRGNEKNKMLTRIYGTAFFTKEELDTHLNNLEEAKKRDHRKLGKQLNLYFIDEVVGKGLVMWLPNGTIIRKEIEKLVDQMEEEAGYLRVTTPHIAREELFIKSGHLPYYKESMYPPMTMDDGTYYLKAMNCPHHHQIFLHQPRSYRDFPVRLAEYGTCYRNELSGTLAGLLRVRAMAMNDAHIYCTKDQIKTEFKSVIELTLKYFKIFGLKDYWFRLSKWEPSNTEKYINEPENWQYSEQIIRELLQEMKVTFVEADDEAAFYGPKVDVQFKSAIGREETMSTIQLDFAAKERFKLSYTDSSGQENHDVFVIHRAPLSVHERFLAFLIEHFAGAFPVWLHPIQAVIIPIGENHVTAADSLNTKLKVEGIRVEMWTDESLSKRIRLSEQQKVPYIIVLGNKEVESHQISVRARGKIDLGSMEIPALIDRIKQKIHSKALDL